MKKWLVAAIAAFALNAQAGLIWWGFYDSEPRLDDTGLVTVYLFALGNSEYLFGDGSLNLNGDTPTLTALVEGLPNGDTFSGMDNHTIGFVDVNPYESTSLAVLETDPLPLNQWWAVVFVDGGHTPDRFGVDVFEVTEMDEWFRLLVPGGEDVGYTSGLPWNEIIDRRFHPSQYGPIPEPATGLLVLGGAAMLLLRRRRR